MNEDIKLKEKLLRNLSDQILDCRSQLRAKKSELLLLKNHKRSFKSTKLETLSRENSRLKSQFSLMNSYQNALVLSRIKNFDPKLYSLFQKYQTAESENLRLKSSLAEHKEQKDSLTTQYFKITRHFLEEEKLKLKLKELENDCKGKTENIDSLSNFLSVLKLKISRPGPSQFEISRFQQLYSDLKYEQGAYLENIKRLTAEYEIVCTLISSYVASPGKRSASSDRIKDQLVIQSDIRSDLERKIKAKEQYRNNVKSMLDRAQGMPRSKDSSFAETERNYSVIKLGKEVIESRSNALKKLKKFYQGTPVARVAESNRSFCLNKTSR